IPRILNGFNNFLKKGESFFFPFVILQFIIKNTSEQTARCALSHSFFEMYSFILMQNQMLLPMILMPDESIIKFNFLFDHSVSIIALNFNKFCIDARRICACIVLLLGSTSSLNRAHMRGSFLVSIS